MASLNSITVQIDTKAVAEAVEQAMLRMQVAARPSSNMALPALAAAACAKAGGLQLSRRSFLFPWKHRAK